MYSLLKFKLSSFISHIFVHKPLLFFSSFFKDLKILVSYYDAHAVIYISHSRLPRRFLIRTRMHKRVIALPWTESTGWSKREREREGGGRRWGSGQRREIGLRDGVAVARVAEAHGGLMHQHQSGLPVQLLHSTHWSLPFGVRWCTLTWIAQIKRTHVHYSGVMRIQTVCTWFSERQRDIEKKRKGVSEWVSEWMSNEWVSEWVRERKRGEREREKEREREREPYITFFHI